MTLAIDLLTVPEPGSGSGTHEAETVHEQLTAFYAAYTRAAAGGDIASWPGFFTADCMYWVTSQANIGAGRPLPVLLCDGQAMARDRAAAILSTQVFRPRRLRYLISGLRITGRAVDSIFTDADFAAVETLQGAVPQVTLAGRCQDEVVLEPGGRMLFRRRAVVLDHDVIPGELVYPL